MTSALPRATIETTDGFVAAQTPEVVDAFLDLLGRYRVLGTRRGESACGLAYDVVSIAIEGPDLEDGAVYLAVFDRLRGPAVTCSLERR